MTARGLVVAQRGEVVWIAASDLTAIAAGRADGAVAALAATPDDRVVAATPAGLVVLEPGVAVGPPVALPAEVGRVTRIVPD